MMSVIYAPTGTPGRKLIDLGLAPVNAGKMDEDDFFSSKPQDPLTLLVKQDLGPLSVDELGERIEILKGEIARIEQHLSDTARHRDAADELFKK
jgi:uncharacterized small protein (DUF1192 family)